MVRVGRLSFDDGEERDREGEREHFTEADERFLESFTPPAAKPPEGSQRRRTPRKRSQSTRKHLADADWLNPQRPKPKKRVRKAD